MSKLRLYGSTSGYNELINIAGFTSNGYAASTFVANNNVVTVDTVNNRLGIGTASPSTELDVNGTITDDVSDVRRPRRTAISTDTTIADEGVYYCTNAPTLTLGAPSAGVVMTIYNNNVSSMTLNRGSTINSMRKGADNNSTNNATLTLGARSTTTITMFQNGLAIVTGTDVT
jgi:hypothetical protein